MSTTYRKLRAKSKDKHSVRFNVFAFAKYSFLVTFVVTLAFIFWGIRFLSVDEEEYIINDEGEVFVTNQTGQGFTVSFSSSEKQHIKLGVYEDTFSNRIKRKLMPILGINGLEYDDIRVREGFSSEFYTHYFNVEGLESEKQYGIWVENEEGDRQYLEKKVGIFPPNVDEEPTEPVTASSRLYLDGKPFSGAILYLSVNGSEMSALTATDGGFLLNLSDKIFNDGEIPDDFSEEVIIDIAELGVYKSRIDYEHIVNDNEKIHISSNLVSEASNIDNKENSFVSKLISVVNAQSPGQCEAQGHTWCGSDCCNDGWCYGPGCWHGGSCEARNQEACQGHGGSDSVGPGGPSPSPSNCGGVETGNIPGHTCSNGRLVNSSTGAPHSKQNWCGSGCPVTVSSYSSCCPRGDNVCGCPGVSPQDSDGDDTNPQDGYGPVPVPSETSSCDNSCTLSCRRNNAVSNNVWGRCRGDGSCECYCPQGTTWSRDGTYCIGTPRDNTYGIPDDYSDSANSIAEIYLSQPNIDRVSYQSVAGSCVAMRTINGESVVFINPACDPIDLEKHRIIAPHEDQHARAQKKYGVHATISEAYSDIDFMTDELIAEANGGRTGYTFSNGDCNNLYASDFIRCMGESPPPANCIEDIDCVRRYNSLIEEPKESTANTGTVQGITSTRHPLQDIQNPVETVRILVDIALVDFMTSNPEADVINSEELARLVDTSVGDFFNAEKAEQLRKYIKDNPDSINFNPPPLYDTDSKSFIVVADDTGGIDLAFLECEQGEENENSVEVNVPDCSVDNDRKYLVGYNEGGVSYDASSEKLYVNADNSNHDSQEALLTGVKANDGEEFSPIQFNPKDIEAIVYRDLNDNNAYDADVETRESVSGVQIKVKQIEDEDTHTYEVDHGWGLYAFPFVNENLSAESLIGLANSQGAEIVEIATYEGKSWKLFKKVDGTEYTFEDFSIEAGQAYFIKSSNEASFDIIDSMITDYSYDLEYGWNMIGFPRKEFKDSDYSSVQFLQSHQERFDRLYTYEDGRFNGLINSDGDIYGKDFKLDIKKGYFVHSLE